MYLMRQIGRRGVYGHPGAARFHGFPELDRASPGSGTASTGCGLRSRWSCWRRPWSRSCSDGSRSGSRVTGVYLSIITQALTYALMLAFFRNDMGFGGNNGFTDFKDIAGFDLQRDSTRAVLFVASALALAAATGYAARSPIRALAG
jgi:urea transport system permease protein